MPSDVELTIRALMGAPNQEPFLRALSVGQWGTPAQLYNQYRYGSDSLSPDDARHFVRKSVGLDNPDLTTEELEELMRNQPGS